MPPDNRNASHDSMRGPAPLCCRGSALCRLGKARGWLAGIRKLERGERLPAQRNGHLRFRVVRSGLVATCAVTPAGRRRIRCLNMPGDVVCQMATEGAESWCEALAGTQVCELDFTAEFRRLGSTPPLAASLLQKVNGRVERSSARMAMFGRLGDMERFCTFLAGMAQRIGEPRGEGWRVSLPMSHADIADHLGLSAATVGRLMTRIEDAGLARFPAPDTCEIPDLDQLKSGARLAPARRGSETPPEYRELSP